MRSELETAFTLFSENAIRLQLAQEALKEKIHSLQREVKESHKTLENVVSQLSSGLFFVNTKGVITIFNLEAEKILNKKKEKVLLKPFQSSFEDTLFGFSMKQALTFQIPSKKIFLKLFEKTKEKEIEVAFTPILNLGVLVVLNDISKIRKLERVCQQSTRLKEMGEMAATLAHEIRNPLTSIEGYASLLQREIEDPSHLSMVKAILEGTHLLNRLVTQVLNYTKPLTPHFEWVEIGSLIKDLKQFGKIKKKNCLFKNSCKQKQLKTDKELLLIASLHLLRNAFEASPHAEVEVAFFETKKNFSIAFKDRGEGIPKEHIENLFTPFFTTKIDGNGLGLTEVYKIISVLGGTIIVTSKIKKGTTFTIHLPK